jgi:DNA-binding MarR family transcriptional regulator
MNNTLDTQIAAWKNMQEHLGYAQKQVLIAVEQYPNSTNNELAGILDWQINRITGRINELRKLNLVVDGGKRKDRITGNTAHVWHMKPPIELPPAREEIKATNLLFQ